MEAGSPCRKREYCSLWTCLAALALLIFANVAQAAAAGLPQQADKFISAAASAAPQQLQQNLTWQTATPADSHVRPLSSRMPLTRRTLLQDWQQQQQQNNGQPGSPSPGAPSTSPSPSPLAPPTVIIIQNPAPPGSAPGSPQAPTPVIQSPSPVPEGSPNVSSSPGTAVKPEDPRPDEGVPAVLQKDGAADTIAVTLVVKGVTPDFFNANLRLQAANVTATLSKTPADKWTMQPLRQQQQSGRKLLQQQGVVVTMSVYTTNPQVVWYRLAKMPPASNAASSAACATEYCSRLVAAGISVDSSGITVTPSYDSLLGSSSNGDGLGLSNITQAIQTNTSELAETRNAAWQGALAVTGFLILVVCIWKRRAIMRWFERTFRASKSGSKRSASKRAKKDAKKSSSSKKQGPESRQPPPPSPEASTRPSSELTTPTSYEVSTSDLNNSELTASELTPSEQPSDQPSDMPEDEYAQPDSPVAAPAPAPAAAALMPSRSVSPLSQPRQQPVWPAADDEEQEISAPEEDWQDPVPSTLVRFDSAERRKFRAAAAAGTASRSGSAASSIARVASVETSSVSSSAVFSEGSSFAAAAAARKISVDGDAPMSLYGYQNAALAVAYKSRLYDDTASESSSQYHEIEVATGKLKAAKIKTKAKMQQQQQQQQRRQQQLASRSPRSLDPLEQQALANYFGRIKQQQGQQAQMVAYRTSPGLSAAALADLDQQQVDQD